MHSLAEFNLNMNRFNALNNQTLGIHLLLHFVHLHWGFQQFDIQTKNLKKTAQHSTIK